MARGDLHDAHFLALDFANGDPEFGLRSPIMYAKPSGKTHIVSISIVRSLLKRGLLAEQRNGSLRVTPEGHRVLSENAGRLTWLADNGL